ncbi:MAG: hypothetical protein WCD35_08640 [Mycobacteriales bacterium]
MTRRLPLLLAAVTLVGVVVTPSLATTSRTLTLTASGSASGLLHLPAGVHLAWSSATVSTSGHYAALMLDRLVPDRAKGTTTAVLATAPGLGTVRSAPADSASYPAGFYRLATVGDAPVTFHVSWTGMPSRHVTLTGPLRPSASRVDAAPSGVAPYAAQAPAGRGAEAVVALSRWDTTRSLGMYDANADVCLATTAGSCQGPATSEHGLSTGVSDPSSLTSGLVTVRAAGSAAARAITHLTGSEQATRVRLLVLSVPLVTIPAPIRSGALQAAAAVPDGHGDVPDVRLRVGRLGSAMPAVYTATGMGPAGIADPAVSPDGTQVAFVESTAYCQRLAVVFADGSAHRFLTPTSASTCMGLDAPVWSPDGTRIWVGGYDSNGRSHAWVVDVDGASPAQALRLPSGAVPMGISPDSRLLVVMLPPARGQRWNRTGVVRTDGSGLRIFPGQGVMGSWVSPLVVRSRR